MPRGVLQTHSLTWETNGVKCWVLPRRGELAALPGATRAERTEDDGDDNLMAVVTAMAVPPAICLRRFSTLAAHQNLPRWFLKMPYQNPTPNQLF